MGTHAHTHVARLGQEKFQITASAILRRSRRRRREREADGTGEVNGDGSRGELRNTTTRRTHERDFNLLFSLAGVSLNFFSPFVFRFLRLRCWFFFSRLLPLRSPARSAARSRCECDGNRNIGKNMYSDAVLRGFVVFTRTHTRAAAAARTHGRPDTSERSQNPAEERAARKFFYLGDDTSNQIIMNKLK